MSLISLIFAVVAAVLFFCSADGQEPLELKYRLEEEQAIGTFVGNVVQDANLGTIYDPPTLRQLQFRFLRHSSLFLIDDSKGTISTATRIDREAMCPGAESCDIRLDVVIQPHVHFRIIRVDVTLIDINDNTPQFDSLEKIVGVAETSSLGAVVFVPSATDLDSPAYSVQRYVLETDSDRFELIENERQSEGGGFDANLVLVRSLDRESVDGYYLTILAIDGGYPQNTGSIGVTVKVIDVNDNKPVFEYPVYNVSIPEDIPPRSTIVRVQANDLDIDLNGLVTYSFSPQTVTSHGRLFGINNQTGDIFVREPLDHEEGQLYRLNIIAQDRGLDSTPVTAIVNVLVTDVNDNPPEVTILTLSSKSRVAEISEDSRPGTFVAQVTIVDGDSGENGRFECSLNDTHFAMIPIYDSEYQLVTTSVLDRETRSEYRVTLTCSDFGTERLTSREQLTVVVSDVNDNDPVFSQSVYRDELFENNYIGATLFQVNATDMDSGLNSLVSYRVDGEAATWFSVEPETGLVKALVSFDREENDQLRFHIVASDRGSPSRSSSVLAVVAILDVNDERPVFSHPGYSLAIHENQPAGSEVGAVAAIDRDSSIYGDITYSIVPVHGSESFEIDYKTGMISTMREFDRESQSSYTLVVVASDRGVPPLSNTATATIYISDVNDNAPVFDYPTQTNNTIYISNRTPRGHVVTRLRAHDSDVGKNGKIFYSISEETKNDLFDLDIELGTVMVSGDLLELDGQQYFLEFLAKDEGDPQKVSLARLSIVVNRSVAFLFDSDDGASPMTQHNFTIVLLLTIISVIIIVVLIAAIIVICRQDRGKETHKYNCRTETLKMLSKGLKPSSSDCSDLSATAQHGSTPASEEKVRKDFMLATADSNRRLEYEVDERSLPHYCTSTFDHQVSAQTSFRPQHYYPSPSIKSSNGSLHRNGNASIIPGETGVSSERQLSRGNNAGFGSKTSIGQHPQPSSHHAPTSRENEVERLLKALQRGDRDSESLHSGDGSNTDSGHGPSEEGEGLKAGSHPSSHNNHAENLQSEFHPTHNSRSPASYAKRS